ncbi:MAG TPA: class I SAM-dependent methyltransferase [Acidimicrobiales bacterium]|nr:class I SAM-dependent methyltransferase [Acidimicrobiales bacterium]
MAERTETLLAGEYFVAVQGFAMMRTCLTEPSAARPRMEEIKGVIDTMTEFPQSLAIPMTEHGVEDGYTRWAPRYDGPNPAIEAEQPVVHAMLTTAPRGVALDAACGTGRHAAKLVELGYDVIGVDATEAMLAVAREKVPSADLRRGRLEDLPVDDNSVDLVTCALSLTHVPSLEPVLHEFGRVLRSGGQAVLSDIHPVATMTGGIAGFPESDITKGIPYVVNLTHHVSEYIRGFTSAGLSVLECVEPLVTEAVLPVFPSYALFPDATRQAFLGSPYLLVWRVERTAPPA